METKGCALGAKTATPFLSPSFLQHPSCLPPSCNTLLVSLLPATPSSFPSFLLVSLPSIHTHPLPHSPSQPFSSQLPGEHPEGPGSSHEGCLSELWGGRVCVCEARGSLTAQAEERLPCVCSATRLPAADRGGWGGEGCGCHMVFLGAMLAACVAEARVSGACKATHFSAEGITWVGGWMGGWVLIATEYPAGWACAGCTASVHAGYALHFI